MNREELTYRLITSDSELKCVCELALQAKYVALDTEFVRTRTYFPSLGLIQLYDGKQLVLIDPLSITDWQPFCQLLIAENVIKILHACNEDLEVFSHEFDVIVQPVIDTQILAAFDDYQLSTGFATLVEEKLQVNLDKSESRTDWLARPLSAKQCYYAAADVYYLLPLAFRLFDDVKQKHWLDAAINECQRVCRRRLEPIEPTKAYLDITNAWQLTPRQLSILQLLAAWRLNYAQTHNMALNFVVKEEHLRLLAETAPTTLNDLRKLGLTSAEIRHHGIVLLKLVQQGLALDENQLPKQIERLIDCPNYKKAFKSLKSLLQTLAVEKSINSELLSSRRQINQLLKWHWQKREEPPVLMSDWRGKLVAQQITEALKEY